MTDKVCILLVGGGCSRRGTAPVPVPAIGGDEGRREGRAGQGRRVGRAGEGRKEGRGEGCAGQGSRVGRRREGRAGEGGSIVIFIVAASQPYKRNG